VGLGVPLLWGRYDNPATAPLVTAFGLVASLAWTATAVLFVARLSAFAHRWLSMVEKRSASKQPEPPVEIPNDLTALALSETEKWAQDSVLEAIRERYAALHDWNKVRAAMGIGAIDT